MKVKDTLNAIDPDPMTELEMQQSLYEIIEEGWESLISTNEANELRNVRTFEEVGMMTQNKGIVVTMGDGSKFALTINRMAGKFGF